MGWRDWFGGGGGNSPLVREVLTSLVNIEVNTVIKDGMTAAPMPEVPHALLDLAGAYRDLLEGMEIDLTPFLKSPDPATAVFTWEKPKRGGVRWEMSVSTKTFDILRWAAEKALETPAGERPAGPLSPMQRILLSRVRGNCDMIKLILGRAKGVPPHAPTRASLLTPASQRAAGDLFELSLSDYLLLRKFWEMGTESVVLQTVIHVDGDLINRTRDPAQVRNYDQLLTLHREGVSTSLASWSHLVDTVIQLAGVAVRGIPRR